MRASVLLSPVRDKSIWIGPRLLDRAAGEVVCGTAAALLFPLDLARALHRGAPLRRLRSSWRLAGLQYASIAAIWALLEQPIVAGVNLSSGIALLALVCLLACRRQGERTRRLGRRGAAFEMTERSFCCCRGMHPGKLCLRGVSH